MDELNKTNRLTIVVVIIVLVIITGLITFQRPDVKYVLSPTESLALLNDPSLVITPYQAVALLKDSSGKTVFIDVRNSIAFEMGHIKNAVNIPVRELFSKSSKSTFREIEKSGQTAVLFGETQQQANGPWLMLHQTGYKNVKLFTGKYEQLDPAQADSAIRLLPLYSETSQVDTAALKLNPASTSGEKGSSKSGKTDKKTVSPVKKVSSSGGGC